MTDNEELLRLVEEAYSSFERRIRTTEEKDEIPYLNKWSDIANKHIARLTIQCMKDRGEVK